jgi:hypothetical protein
MRACPVVIVLLLAGLNGNATAGQLPKAAPPAKPAANPWPSAEALATRRIAAERRALFAADEPLAFTLLADFRAVQRDRDPESTRTYPATLVIAGEQGAERSIPLRIRTRGHSRRRPTTCSFAPLRFEFAENPVGTVFEGQRGLKLGTHCRDVDDYEQYVHREYLVYKLFNLFTPRSFRARLGTATYVDAATKKPLSTNPALFLEDDDDVARRLEGRIEDLEKITFRSVDNETITRLTLFAYMIGNTDMSMFRLHNVRLVRTLSGTLYPVPYDFDYAGLVNARYAIPDKQFGLGSVRDRLYRGPCRPAAELEPFLAQMRELRDKVMAVYDLPVGITPGYRRDAKAYLEQFYRTIERPADIKRAFVDNCGNRAGM